MSVYVIGRLDVAGWPHMETAALDRETALKAWREGRDRIAEEIVQEITKLHRKLAELSEDDDVSVRIIRSRIKEQQEYLDSLKSAEVPEEHALDPLDHCCACPTIWTIPLREEA